MEAEIIAFGNCCHVLFPIIALVDEIGVAIEIKKPDDNPDADSCICISPSMRTTLVLCFLQLLHLLNSLLAAFGFTRRSLSTRSRSPY
jgi:hypothetical protein